MVRRKASTERKDIYQCKSKDGKEAKKETLYFRDGKKPLYFNFDGASQLTLSGCGIIVNCLSLLFCWYVGSFYQKNQLRIEMNARNPYIM